MSENKIQLFDAQQIRTEWDADAEKWWFSVLDVVAVLTDQPDYKKVRNYWKWLKNKLIAEGSQLVSDTNQLKMVAADGKRYKTDVMDTEQLLRLIQSIPSKKAEPFKLWLAQVGSARLDQLEDPELSIEQAMRDYTRLGYSDNWINQRLKSIEIRKELTDEWKKRGLAEGQAFATLTDIIYKTWAGKTTKEYKQFKGLKKENLRDNMTNKELVMNMLAELSTKEISEVVNPQSMDEHENVATDSRYFANTTQRNKNSFDFTMNWAKADNSLIKDLKDFTATFFQKHTLLNVLLHYSVFDVSNTLLVMRPYQIAATERILWKINSAYQAKNWSQLEGGGFIWHTTGSGKTLTSFKAARLATELDFIDKVFFVVDRKDLDYQTMKEYQRFSPDSVNGSDSTAGLKRNLEKDDNKIVVTTIQKLNNLMKSETDLPIYGKQVVFIFDECHRSQFGEAQKNLKKKFKKFYQFGFTGTPIFPENALGAETTASVFGRELHSYVITDAIRDEKVLKFKVDYNDVRPQFKAIETEQDEKKLSAAENKQALLHPDRIREITQYILNNFRQKTHRLQAGNKGFNAMFAVSSVDAAKLYYESFRELQKGGDKPLRVATIFSFAANEEQEAIGDIQDESFDVSAMNSSAKEFLSAAIADYNALFKTNFSVDSNGFQNYYRDLAKQVKAKEIDLLIVVGMFLTGFDAPTLNTLFVDKNLRYHGLMQAFSRTNRIFDATKTFGNIVTFRDLEQATIDAITLFGDKNTKNVVLEKSYKEYMEGFTDVVTGEARRGFVEVVKELETRFPDPAAIEKEADKKAFAKLFGEYLRVENVLQNYDEFASLKELQSVDMTDPAAVEAFKAKHYLNDDDLTALQAITLPAERKIQDYRSTYNDVRDWLRREKTSAEKEKSTIDWDDVVFEVDLLKSQEINLDYILELIFEHNKKIKSKSELVDEARRVIRASLGNRAKESLLVDFINQTDLDQIGDKACVIDAFFTFAQGEHQ